MSFPTSAVLAILLLGLPLAAQELEPDSYAIVPKGVNVLTTNYTNQSGDVNFDPSLPVEQATARISLATIAYGRSLNVYGRSASALVAVPYAAGTLQGLYLGNFVQVRRSGLADPRMKFTVNLIGGPAMTLQEIARKPPRTTLGFAMWMVAPLGQYDAGRLINLGANRWGFRPELGLSHTFSKRWRGDLYAGTWLFTDNTNFNGGLVRKQKPITSVQAHVYYGFRPGMWLSGNANYYYGGRTTIANVVNFDLQANARLGATFAYPVRRRHSLRFAASYGAVNRIGADFLQLGMSYTYLWGGGF